MSRVPGSLVSPELLDQIYRVVREVLRDGPGVEGGQARHRGNPAYIGYTTSTISARSGTTPGTGTAELRYLTDAGVYAASGDERTVYSHAESTIANGSYVLVAMCGGRLEIVPPPAAAVVGGCTSYLNDLTYTIAGSTFVLADLSAPGNLGGLTFALDASSKAITVPSAGLYLVTLNGSAQGTRTCFMDFEIMQQPAASPSSTSLGTAISLAEFSYNLSHALVQDMACVGLAQFSAGEHVAIRMSHTSASSNDFTLGASFVRIVRLGD